MKERPVLYLDVDDTILMWPSDRTREWWERHRHGEGAPHVEEFLRFARETFEVRWLTAWALGGTLGEVGEERLSAALGVPIALVQGCDNPLAWGGTGDKTTGINWDEIDAGREWAWVEDGILDNEQAVLRGRHVWDRYYHTNVSRDPMALHRTMQALKQRFYSTHPRGGSK